MDVELMEWRLEIIPKLGSKLRDEYWIVTLIFLYVDRLILYLINNLKNSQFQWLILIVGYNYYKYIFIYYHAI